MYAKKAMVSKIKNGHCMIVTDDGQFKRIPLPRKPVQVGQIIDYKEPSSLKWFKPLLMVASFFVVFLGLYAYQQSLPPGPLTYITLDINPSIQIGLNSSNNVVEAVPLNGDGKKLLAKLDYEGRNYDVVVEDLVDEAANQGYLNNSEENIIVASLYNQTPSPQEKAQELMVRRSIGRSLGNKKIKADVLVYKVDKKVWQEAKKSGLSAGKLAFSMEMQAKGIEISKVELKQDSIKKILKHRLWQIQTPITPAEVTGVYQVTNNPQVYKDVYPPKIVIKKFRNNPEQKVRQIKKARQDKKAFKPNKPNQINNGEIPPLQSPDPEVSETVYDEPTISQEPKKPLLIKPERPPKKVIEKKNEKTNPKKPGN